MRTHTNAFKNQIKKFGREYSVLITGNQINLTNSDIYSLELVQKGDLLKTAMKELTFSAKNNIALNTELILQIGIKVNNAYEYINYGKFLVYSSEKQEDKDLYEIVCYDKMLLFMVDYESLNIQYPITVSNYIRAICNKVGITFKNQGESFANYNKTIPSELYLDSDGNSLEYTYRDVLDELAQVTASTIMINSEDKLAIVYPQQKITGNVIELEDEEIQESPLIFKVEDGLITVNWMPDIVILDDIGPTPVTFEIQNVNELKIDGPITINFNNNLYDNGMYFKIITDKTTHEFQLNVDELIEEFTANDEIVDHYELYLPSQGFNNLQIYPQLYMEETITEDFFKDNNVTFGEKYGPINSIVLSRNDVDNVYLQDEDSIEENGLCEIKIVDNQIMNFNDRSNYLQAILDKLDGLEYYISDFSSPGILYYEICDMYNAKIGNTKYNCIMFNDEIKVRSGLSEDIYTERPEKSETDYTKADKTDRKINHTQLMVDKQQGIIQSLVDNTTVVSDTKSGTGSITLENAFEGQLYKLSIKGQISLEFPRGEVGQYGSLLVPYATLTPSSTLAPSGKALYLTSLLYPSSTTYTKSNVLIIDDEEYELDFDYLNYINNDIADEFVCENGECKIVRRVGIDSQGNKYALSSEVIEIRKPVILNVKSSSTISLKSFDAAVLSSTYLLQNDITSNFATEAYVNSSITQTADTINLEVASKLDGEDFTGANIMLQINRDESQAQINADKISLAGKTINLTSDNIAISSTNFSLDTNGNMTANSGTFGGTVNTSQNLTVGNNAYIGQNQSSTGDAIKYIYMANDAYIKRQIFSNIGSYMQIESGYQLNLKCGSSYMYMFNDNYITMSSEPSYGSDERLKKDIKDKLDVAWIDDLKVKEYKYKNSPSKKHIGLVAQDYLKKEYSDYFVNSYLNENNEEYYSINYNNITNALIKYCQELKQEVNELKTEVRELKNEKNNN